jgi:hypothetical protein
MADYNIVMSNSLSRICLACATIAVFASSVAAQSAEWNDASALYGRGVHAYFAGRSNDADAHLSRALALDPDDPRAYYFRALCRMRLGRADEARADMEIGAAIEARHPDRFGVGVSLQRVQGADRLALEKVRRQARDAARDVQQLDHPQFEPVNYELQYLYQPVIVPLEEFLGSGEPRALSAEELEQRAAVSRADAMLPLQTARPTTSTSEPDPFQDDAPAASPSATPVQPAPTASSAEEVAEIEEADTAAETEEAMPAEADEPVDSALDAEAAPEDASSSDDDPFSEFSN